MTHHTKTLGDLGVLHSKIDLMEKGFVTCSPDTEHAPYDVVACKEGRCYTIQVKARTVTDRGSCEIWFRSVWADKKGNHIKQIDKSLIDVYCLYCTHNKKCYYFNPDNYNKSIAIRFVETKNGSRQGINWHEDFLEFPKLP
tara:strand:- start:85 stop:507 length:423 start_codon:yes stop_codon:yes gene_type:complete